MVPRVRAVLLPLLIGTLLAAATPTSGQDAAPPQAIYFQPAGGLDEERNFTTLPPAPNETGRSVQFVQVGLHARLPWSLPYLPADWTIEAGTTGTATLYLSGLDGLIPVPRADDPDTAMATPPGEVLIMVEVVDGTGQRMLASGNVSHQPRPDAPVQGPRAWNVTLMFREDVTLVAGPPPDGEGMIVLVRVTGRAATNISPVHLHVYANETASRLELPAFPYEALRAWDLAEHAPDCERLRLLQRPCPEDEGDDDVEPTPATPAGVLILLIVLGLTRLRARVTAPSDTARTRTARLPPCRR